MKKVIVSKRCKNIVLIGVAVGLIGGSMPGTAFAVSRGRQMWGKAKTALSSQAKKALGLLQKYSGKANQGTQKLIACLRGKDTCTEKEIKNTRIYVGVVSSALAILAAAGLFFAGKRLLARSEQPGEPAGGGGQPVDLDKVQEFSNRIKAMDSVDIQSLPWDKIISLELDTTMQQWVRDNWNHIDQDVRDMLQRLVPGRFGVAAGQIPALARATTMMQGDAPVQPGD